MNTPVSSLIKIVSLRALDVRFPTSRSLGGSDAINPDPDYSAAYCILETDPVLEGGRSLESSIPSISISMYRTIETSLE